MCTIYFKDKDISFTTNNNYNNENIVIFAYIPTICEVAEALDNAQGVSIQTDSSSRAFEQFAVQFKNVVAGGGLVKNPLGEVLMILRNGVWDLPKGKCEVGEPIEQCAVREVEEECGITGLEIVKLRTITYHIYDTYGEWVLKPTYWYDMVCDNLREPYPQTEEGIERVEWVKEMDVEERLKYSYSTIKKVFKISTN